MESYFDRLVPCKPPIGQTRQLIDFCRRYDYLYIYGCADSQRFMAKYLGICDISLKGFLISESEKKRVETYSDDSLVITPGELPDLPNERVGVILGLPDIYYNEVMEELKKSNITNVFFPSEQSKFAIAQKVCPTPKELFWFETNIVDHCNLNCQMCDHFSPVAPEKYLDPAVYERDMKKMSELTCGDCRVIKLEGGEPLLHPKINEFIRIARHYFPKTPIYLYTNGILLSGWENNPNGNLFRTCRESRTTIALTEYPIKLDYDAVKAKAQEYGIYVLDVTTRREGVKYSVKHPFDLSGMQDKYQFVDCFCFSNCISLKDGKLYPCSVLPNSSIFNEAFNMNLEITSDDFLDIHKASCYDEIAEFVSKRPPFCRYCVVNERSGHDWKTSTRRIEEWMS